ncbi:MAG: hypothetical protein ACLTDS_02340 [Bianqueaceae bacterium]
MKEKCRQKEGTAEEEAKRKKGALAAKGRRAGEGVEVRKNAAK